MGSSLKRWKFRGRMDRIVVLSLERGFGEWRGAREVRSLRISEVVEMGDFVILKVPLIWMSELSHELKEGCKIPARKSDRILTITASYDGAVSKNDAGGLRSIAESWKLLNKKTMLLQGVNSISLMFFVQSF